MLTLVDALVGVGRGYVARTVEITAISIRGTECITSVSGGKLAAGDIPHHYQCDPAIDTMRLNNRTCVLSIIIFLPFLQQC